MFGFEVSLAPSSASAPPPVMATPDQPLPGVAPRSKSAQKSAVWVVQKVGPASIAASAPPSEGRGPPSAVDGGFVASSSSEHAPIARSAHTRDKAVRMAE